LDRICDRIEDYEEGQLARKDEVEFENHLGSCPSCREKLEWMKSLDLMFSKGPVKTPPRGLERAVLKALGFGQRRVWAPTLGWATASFVGAWLVALPLIVRATGFKSIAPIARGVAALPSLISSFVSGLQVSLSLLRPASVTIEALAKAAGHTHLPIVVAVILAIGLASGLGIWHNLRGVRYARVHA
jgi:hypothetical protein